MIDKINNIFDVLEQIGEFAKTCGEYLLQGINAILKILGYHEQGMQMFYNGMGFVFPVGLASIFGVCMGISIIYRIFGRE